MKLFFEWVLAINCLLILPLSFAAIIFTFGGLILNGWWLLFLLAVLIFFLSMGAIWAAAAMLD